MELPHVLGQFVHAKEEKKELFLSLLLDIDGVIASTWQVSEKRLPIAVGVASQDVTSDSWDARLAAADQAISSLQTSSLGLNKVILGLPASYLTETGDIKQTVRPHLKKLMHSLGLSPMGFVSIHQAIVHQLKHEEGVPPTAILLGIAGPTVTVSVYKIGSLVGQKTIEQVSDIVLQLEEVLQSFTELEVLPSRILLYGTHHDHLEEVKRELLRHPWQTRANFMHFPKIDVFSQDNLMGAISLVGVNELATSLGPEPEDAVAETAVHEEEPNVVLVDPTSLGFKRSVDVLHQKKELLEKEESIEHSSKQKRHIALPKLSFSFLPLFSHLPSGTSARLPVITVAVIVFLALIFGLYWFIPRVSATVYEVPKKLTKTITLTVDPTATVPDSASKILPGKPQEKSISGEKTIPVTGKKQVGDPAKGAVTMTNRTLYPLTLPKGTIFTSGDLQFTLDNTVVIASPSSVFQLTTNTGTITASVIGAKSNLAAGTIFTIKGYSLSEAAAQNDKGLAGGTSRDVTVVTRADQDTLIKALTQELVDKAKQELASAVGNSEQLIDATVKTSVKERSFVEELDQEAGNLHGKATITVSGVSYGKSDLATFLAGVVASDIPSGYVFDPKFTNATLQDVEVKKDGKVAATAQFEGIATPQLDLTAIRRTLAGKSISGAQEYLKNIPGVGAVSFRFQLHILKSRLPANANNISINVAVQE